MFDAGIANADLIYAINGSPTRSIDSLEAVISRHKVGDVVQVEVEQRLVRRTIPMKLRGRRAMRIATYEALGLPITPAVSEFRRSWLGSKRANAN